MKPRFHLQDREREERKEEKRNCQGSEESRFGPAVRFWRRNLSVSRSTVLWMGMDTLGEGPGHIRVTAHHGLTLFGKSQEHLCRSWSMGLTLSSVYHCSTHWQHHFLSSSMSTLSGLLVLPHPCPTPFVYFITATFWTSITVVMAPVSLVMIAVLFLVLPSDISWLLSNSPWLRSNFSEPALLFLNFSADLVTLRLGSYIKSWYEASIHILVGKEPVGTANLS